MTDEQAEAKAEIQNIATIERAASVQWTAAAWFLEHRYPQKYGSINQSQELLGSNMCTYSVISEYGQFRIAPDQWSRDSWSDYQEILRRLDALDKKLSQPDCLDPAKAAWMQSVEDRFHALERAGQLSTEKTIGQMQSALESTKT